MTKPEEGDKPNKEGNPLATLDNREGWLSHPHTKDLEQTLLTVATGFMQYLVNGCNSTESQLREAIHRANTLMAISQYVKDGDYAKLVRGLNLIEGDNNNATRE